MPRSALALPETDPTPIFELFRGSYGSELLTAAIAHFDIFGQLAKQPLSFEELANALQLAVRPATVLITALRAMNLLSETNGKLAPSDLAREHLVPGGYFDVGNYVGLAAQSPGVTGMVQLLKSNQPLGSDGAGSGTAFIYRDGMESAMEAEQSARHLTLALAGRAKNVAPALAQAVPIPDHSRLLDIGGGTGIYSYALLEQNPTLNAIVLDRPEVLKVADEMAQDYNIMDRIEFMPGDMFADQLPTNINLILLSNILHDWDVAECQQLVNRCVAALAPGGRILIHDVFLNDEHDGPLPIALYSAALFSLTEGRAYSVKEYRAWLHDAGLSTGPVQPTGVHCGVLTGTKN
ncbi:methyltransferase [Rhodopirellula sp.]|nr:methyltransferase [Rhodopirellula sp.]